MEQVLLEVTVKLMLSKHPNYKIINTDALTYAGNLEKLKMYAIMKLYFYKS